MPGHGASFGHAGGIAVTWVSPQGLPGVIRNLPKWILDPLGPVAIRWPYLPKLLPWFARLQRHSGSSEVERIGDILASLMVEAWPAWNRLLTEVGMASAVHHDGALTAYRTHENLRADHIPWDMRRERGFTATVLGEQELREREPALSTGYRAAVYEPEAKWCDDPMSIIASMVERLHENGAQVLAADVSSLVTDSAAVRAIRTSAGTTETDVVVIAAGAWSHRLTAQLGHRVPLESERGYHVDLPNADVQLQQILSLAPHKMVATPLAQGLRISGTAEFGGVDSPPDYRRARALIEHARKALPGLNVSDYSEWSGERPILPDSLPIIGRDPLYENVYYAFGHSHIGFTLGPVTGEIIAALVNDDTPSASVDQLRIDRFKARRP